MASPKSRLPRIVVGVESAALVVFPVSVPTQSHSGAHHHATEVAIFLRYAPGARTIATRPAGGSASKRGAFDLDVPCGQCSCRAPEERGEIVPGAFGRHRGAWLITSASSVHLTRGDAGETNLRPLGAPDRTVAVIHGDGCADEKSECRYDGHRSRIAALATEVRGAPTAPTCKFEERQPAYGKRDGYAPLARCGPAQFRLDI